MAAIQQLKSQLLACSLLEAAELVRNWNRVWAFRGGAPVMVAGGAAAGAAAPAEEKTEFRRSEEVGANKIM